MPAVFYPQSDPVLTAKDVRKMNFMGYAAGFAEILR